MRRSDDDEQEDALVRNPGISTHGFRPTGYREASAAVAEQEHNLVRLTNPTEVYDTSLVTFHCVYTRKYLWHKMVPVNLWPCIVILQKDPPCTPCCGVPQKLEYKQER